LLIGPSRGDVPSVYERSPLLIDMFMPETPRQHDEWKAPPNKVPDEFVTAAWLLFQQGLADPRGCDYGEIEVILCVKRSKLTTNQVKGGKVGPELLDRLV
jgi:hypothetical protein